MATKTLGVATDEAESDEPVGRAKELALQRLRATGRLISLRGAHLHNSQTEREDEAESELRKALAMLQEATALSEWDAGSWIALGDTLGELMRLPSIAPDAVVDHNGDGVASTYHNERIASYEYAAEAFAKNGSALPLATVYALATLYLKSGEVRVPVLSSASQSPMAYLRQSVGASAAFARSHHPRRSPQQYALAKAKFAECVLTSNGQFPSAWRGVGVAARKMGALKEAEDALAEANMLNVSSPATWAQLALLCAAPNATAKPRITLAKSCAAEAFRHGLKDGELLAELGATFEELCELPTAERCLRAALAVNDTDNAVRLRFAAGAFAFLSSACELSSTHTRIHTQCILRAR